MAFRLPIRRLLVAMTLVAVVCAAIGATKAWVKHNRLTSDIVREEHWPVELRNLLRDATRDGEVVSSVDVREAGWITTYIWRMPATDSLMERHIKTFRLVPVANRGVEADRIRAHFPLAWQAPQHQNAKVYTYPPGLPGADDGEHEFVLLCDETEHVLYFYYYFNF